MAAQLPNYCFFPVLRDRVHSWMRHNQTIFTKLNCDTYPKLLDWVPRNPHVDSYQNY